MRFEPHLMREDDPDDAPELPDDLAELAAQLSADASYLAARYPAPPGNQPIVTVDWGRRLLRGTAAAVFLCGVGLCAGRLWHGMARPPRAVDQTIAGGASIARTLIDVQGRHPAAGDVAAPGGTAVLFGSLSGGEQEGVLDLLEEQSSDETQVSI